MRKIEKKVTKRCTSFRLGAAGAYQLIIDDLQLTMGGVADEGGLIKC